MFSICKQNTMRGLSWNALPSSSESVYPEITISATQPATDVFSSSDTQTIVFFWGFLSLSLHLIQYDLSVYVKKTKQQKLLLQQVTFSHNMSQIPFLGYMMPHTKQEPQDVSWKDGAWPEVREFSPWNIVFTVTALGEKNYLALQMEAEREERWQMVSHCSRLWAWMSPTPNYVRVCFAHASRN